MTGPGLTLTLDDAHPTQHRPESTERAGGAPVRHAGGGERVLGRRRRGDQVMDQRLVQTSAVRCVGNTLLLNGRVYSPPFSIAAIGPRQQLRAALDVPDLAQYRRTPSLRAGLQRR